MGQYEERVGHFVCSFFNFLINWVVGSSSKVIPIASPRCGQAIGGTFEELSTSQLIRKLKKTADEVSYPFLILAHTIPEKAGAVVDEVS